MNVRNLPEQILTINNKENIIMNTVNTKMLKKNLGNRDSMAVNRNDLLTLIETYDKFIEIKRLDKLEYESKGMVYPADFEPKH